jgi:hypothetical protein
MSPMRLGTHAYARMTFKAVLARRVDGLAIDRFFGTASLVRAEVTLDTQAPESTPDQRCQQVGEMH